MYPMVSGSTESVQGDRLVNSPASSTAPQVAGLTSEAQEEGGSGEECGYITMITVKCRMGLANSSRTWCVGCATVLFVASETQGEGGLRLVAIRVC